VQMTIHLNSQLQVLRSIKIGFQREQKQSFTCLVMEVTGMEWIK